MNDKAFRTGRDWRARSGLAAMIVGGMALFVACSSDDSSGSSTSGGSTTGDGGGSTSTTTTGTGGAGGSGGDAATTTTTTTTATTTTSSGGGGGAGGTGQGGMGVGGDGSGGALPCNPGDVQACYTGPAGTEGVGTCVSGMETCLPDGSDFGPCMGEVLPTTDTCGNNADEDCDGSDAVCLGAPLWQKRLGDAAEQRGYAVDVDGNGNLVICGRTAGTVDFGGGGVAAVTTSDAFFAKYSSAGNYSIAKVFGTTGTHEAQDVSVDGNGNIVIAGRMSGTIDFGGGLLTSTANSNDIFVAKFSSAGVFAWAKRFGDGGDQSAHAVATDAMGNVVVTGRLAGTVDFGGGNLTSAGGRDVYVAKYDGNGNHLGSKRFGGAMDDSPNDIDIDGNGNIVVAGSFNGSVDFGGGALVSGGATDAFVAAYDANGNHLFSKRYGDAAAQSSSGVATDGAGNIYLMGTTAGAIDLGGGAVSSAGVNDVWLTKMSGAGTYQWQKIFGDAQDQSSRFLSANAGGDVVIVGTFAGTINFGGGTINSGGGKDAFVAKLNTNGQHIFSYGAGDGSDQAGGGVVLDGMGNTLLVGQFAGMVDFGLGALTSAGVNDIYIVKFSP